MASIGNNTFGGVSFGIETNGMDGLPDFPTELPYAKRSDPRGTTVNFQYGAIPELAQVSYVVIVSSADWAAFKAKIDGIAKSLVVTGRSGRNARLVKLDSPKEFPTASIPFWRANATWEG